MRLAKLGMVLALASCANRQAQDAPPVERSTAVLHGRSGKPRGTLTLAVEARRLTATVALRGLVPHRRHSLDLHEEGVCLGPNYRTVGPRTHPGVLGAAVGRGDGTAAVAVSVPAGARSLATLLHRALVLHDEDRKGVRVACALIRPVQHQE
jgi:Cu/Zn superoxide dismutase